MVRCSTLSIIIIAPLFLSRTYGKVYCKFHFSAHECIFHFVIIQQALSRDLHSL
ncbi:hypothetical protein HMPREF9083_1035 [Dialister micraerophilus DSM 19965]|uniref:Uncharacterized protein n=1 Tax=Dialister micraerophilus DSM 19965 TaxID=888062 RepID=F2BXW7_9FIRM|nr:hypothetical protein HMPREF9083_1035 [Dialister micraerophilus DSM 19965]